MAAIWQRNDLLCHEEKYLYAQEIWQHNDLLCHEEKYLYAQEIWQQYGSVMISSVMRRNIFMPSKYGSNMAA